MLHRTLIAWVVVAAACMAQLGTEGSILGIVKDGSGAVIPAAAVTVTNTNTGVTQMAATDSAGFFQMLALPRGLYTVEVSASGFSPWQIKGIDLTAGEQRRVQPVLNVGDVKQQVTVEAAPTIVQTERASVEVAIEQKQVRDLPLNGRIAVQLVALTPGMRYLGVTTANVQGVQVQGNGQHSDATQFAVDGMSANDPSTETGMAFPNLEAVDQFRIQTSSFSAENGRNPLQVSMITKSGTNAFHGTLWEFVRNDIFDARNTFLARKPTLRRNQYGFSIGGPVIRNRTFFFSSFEGLNARAQGGYNSITINPAFLNGDFSSIRTIINDPTTARPFAENRIPVARFSNASRYFFPYVLLPNSPNNRFQALAGQPDDNTNFMFRIDHHLSSKQKVYGRMIRVGDSQINTGYKPDVTNVTDLAQYNSAVNYDYTISPTMLLSLTAGFIHSNYTGNSDLVGKENLTEKAGIQGFPTALRAGAIGLPTVAFTGYTGFSWPQQVPSSFKREVLNGRAGINIVRGKHTLVAGAEYLDNRTGVRHASAAPRGSFTFNSQYTGDGFADYLLGLVQVAGANVPLALFGIAHSPYTGMYVDETWRAHPNLTINAGVRWDYWWDKGFVRGGGTTFDLKTGKAIAGENAAGQVDLTAQPVAPFYGAATKDLWVPASQAGFPSGLFYASGFVSPRLGVAWRPFGKDTTVLRGGYGIFASSYYGNAIGSSIIGPPYWASQNATFARASNQRWETAFPADPSNFVFPSIASAEADIKPMKVHEFNVSLQQMIPLLKSAVTLSYVGTRGYDLTAFPRMNTAPPGSYTNLQAALPYPRFGTINLYRTMGKAWYNSLQMKVEKRFSQGLSYLVSYAFSRDISLFGAETTIQPTRFAPENYDRGPSPNERRHILTISGLYELPVGRGKRIGGSMPKVANYIVGGWQVSSIYRFVSGAPLTMVVGGATLGNGVNARPDIVGNPKLDNPGPAQWFNPAAFARPANFRFGNSGPGIITGPALHVLDAGIMKNLFIGEKRYLQFRWEMFNAMNEVNLGNPVTTIALATTGQITSAGDPRIMQLGLKFVF
ncbi:MAG: TonB-dependent receptor [Acidobacteria bacterium]|nr:TonB-dependent receptor [Acidobacteriota bacterium]